MLNPDLIGICSIILILVADQATKYLAGLYLPWQQRVDFIPGLISFFHTRNTGAAFSMFTDQRWLLSAVAITVLFAMCIKRDYLTEGRPMLLVGWFLIFSGALGNLIDRLLYGSVVDFLQFDFVQFPVFNVADVSISCGGALYVAVLLREELLRWRSSKL